MTSFSTAVGGIIHLLKVGVQGVFQSAVALLSQPSMWQGIASRSIVYSVRAALFDLFADLIGKLPATMRFGANVEGLRGNAEADSATSAHLKKAAASAFGNVDLSMSPMAEAAKEAGSVIAQTWSTILGDAASIPEFQKLRDNFAILSDSTRQLVKASMDQKSAQSSSADAAFGQAASNALPSGSAYDMSDTLAKVGGFIGGRGSAMESEQRRTNSLMQMSVDLLKSGIEIWKSLQRHPTWS